MFRCEYLCKLETGKNLVNEFLFTMQKSVLPIRLMIA